MQYQCSRRDRKITYINLPIGAIHKGRPQFFSRFLPPSPLSAHAHRFATHPPVDVRIRDTDPPCNAFLGATKEPPIAFAFPVFIFRRDEGAAYCIRFSRFYFFFRATYSPLWQLPTSLYDLD